MSKCIKMRQFIQPLFDDETMANKAAEIGQAILAVRSLRLTDIVAKMPGNSDASYKRIGRFIRLATAYRGRAIPCGLITYSSKTIATRQDLRNLNHFRVFEGLKDLLEERPLVLDREFSYLELLVNLVEEQVNFVIRLKLGSQPPKFWDSDGREVALTISPGETVIHNRVWYKGQVCVNLIGTWGKGFKDPLWIMTNL